MLFACNPSTMEAEAEGGWLCEANTVCTVSPRPAWVLGEDLSKTTTTTKERKKACVGKEQPAH